MCNRQVSFALFTHYGLTFVVGEASEREEKKRITELISHHIRGNCV